MRVSSQYQFQQMNFQMSRLQAEMADYSFKLSTGKAFDRISEDPLKASQSLLLQESFGQIGQFQQNIQDATGFLSLVETTLGSAVNVLQDVREKAILASNDTYNEQNKQSLAQHVEHAIEEMMTLANTKFLGKYMFSGEKTQTEAFTYDGTAAVYGGDTAPLSFPISTTSHVQISETGDVAFQGVLDDLIFLRDRIQNGTSNDISTGIGRIDASLERVIGIRSDVGARMQGVEAMNDIYEDTKVNLETKKEQVEGVDFTKLITEFMNAQRLYQGTIQANVKVMELSILNFI